MTTTSTQSFKRIKAPKNWRKLFDETTYEGRVLYYNWLALNGAVGFDCERIELRISAEESGNTKMLAQLDAADEEAQRLELLEDDE
jgi:hypothetical protein